MQMCVLVQQIIQMHGCFAFGVALLPSCVHSPCVITPESGVVLVEGEGEGVFLGRVVAVF